MKPLQGNDPNRTGRDASANVTLPGGQSLPTAKTSAKPRTRPPASVRTKEQLVQEAARVRVPEPQPWTGTLPHSAPSVVSRETRTVDGEWLTAQVLKLRSGLAAGSTEQIEHALQELADGGLRFDREPLASHPAAAEFIGTAPIRVLQIHRAATNAAGLVMRLIELGCDPNSCDDLDNTVLMYAARLGLADLTEFLLAECPDLSLHRLNFYGRNAAMIAQANANVQVLDLLTEAGIMLSPPNPAIIFFESNRERFTGANAHEAYEQLWQLLQRTHYINLADATGKTLIFHAVLNQDVDAVLFLCQRSDYPDLSLRDHDNKSVFDYAALISDDVRRRAIIDALKTLRSDVRPLAAFRRQDH
ncbi:MAG: hypothetical protein RL404_1968 [Pseudomonadota bacterium]|jgi:hypothetical protein